jgi:bifunctional DNA-binding transcriptional regulator/antitoxin component of YhaV-PrlF toxin-antitoxin module
VTIPRALREQFGLRPATEVTFEAAAGGILIKAAAAARRRQLQSWLRRARGTSTTGKSTADIMRLTRSED